MTIRIVSLLISCIGFRLQRQKTPAFHFGVDPRNFDSAKVIIGSSKDQSPLSLAVDDTALVPKVRTVYNSERKVWLVVGHVHAGSGVSLGSKIVFKDEADLEAVLRDHNLTRAKKVSQQLQ